MGVVGWGDVAARTLLAAYMVWRCARPRPCASLGIPSTRSLRRGRRGPKHAYTRTCTRAPGQPHTPRAGAWGGRMCHQQARKRAGPRRPSDGVSAMPKDHKTAGAGERTGGSGRRRARACGCVRVPSGGARPPAPAANSDEEVVAGAGGRVCRRALLKYTRTPPTHTHTTDACTHAGLCARARQLFEDDVALHELARAGAQGIPTFAGRATRAQARSHHVCAPTQGARKRPRPPTPVALVKLLQRARAGARTGGRPPFTTRAHAPHTRNVQHVRAQTQRTQAHPPARAS